jgi:MSHA biogenesis protein MshN
MSLINQMLKDLEHRRSQDNPAEGVASGAIHRYSAVANKGFNGLTVFIVIIILLVVAIGFLLWERQESAMMVQNSDVNSEVSRTDTKGSPPPAVAHKAEQNMVATQPEKQLKVVPQSKPMQDTLSVQQQTQPVIETRISSVSPDPVPASRKRQSITINGEGFSQNTRITVAWRENKKNLPRSQVKFLNARQLQIQIVVGSNSDDWTVQAFDPENGESTEYEFKVVGKRLTPDVAVKKIIKPLDHKQQAELLFQQGYQLLSKGQVVAGEQKLLEVLKLYPGHTKAREILAGLYIKSGRVIEAGNLLQAGLELLPKHTLFAKLQGRLLLEQAKTQQAIEVLEKVVPAVKVEPEYHALLAAAYQRQQQHAKAVATYQSLLTVRPAAGVWWIGLGISLEALGRKAQAVEAYEKAARSGSLTVDLLRYTDNRLAALRKSTLPQSE